MVLVEDQHVRLTRNMAFAVDHLTLADRETTRQVSLKELPKR